MSTYQRRERQRKAQSQVNTLKTGNSFDDTGTIRSDSFAMKSPRVAKHFANAGKASINDNGRPTGRDSVLAPNLRRESIEIKRKK